MATPRRRHEYAFGIVAFPKRYQRNVVVPVAALAVRVAGSPEPDIAIGFLIAALFSRSAIAVIREVLSHYKFGL
ncbi:MAG: hypothetical protein JNL29_12020 [Nitrospira sp.]|nr:hypothetical protein [Nitrospira sp.]MBX3319755.1 hypothetical protein [Nitrospira sp.]